MRKITKELYYPWLGEDTPRQPWERHLNQHLMKAEAKRVQETKEWYNQYLKADKGDELDEVKYYSLPADFTKGWEDDIDSKGDFNYKVFSAIKNAPQNPLVALFHDDADLPPDYSIIRVMESEKVYVSNRKEPGKHLYGVIVKEFEVLPDRHLYVDVDHEERIVEKILHKTLGHDKHVSKSLQSPLMSSPIKMGGQSGVGMASLMDKPFVNELHRQLEVMLPPEYRADKYMPKTSKKGQWMDFGNKTQRAKFKVAEKAGRPTSKVGLDSGSSYNVVERQSKNRLSFNGEYSFVGTVTSKGRRSQLQTFQKMLDNFTQHEITTSSLDELRQSDVYLKDLQREIGDYHNLHINLAHSRELRPSVNDKVNVSSFRSEIHDLWDAHLDDMGYKNVGYLRDAKTDKTMDSVENIAQAQARAEGEESVKKKHVKEAVNIITDDLNDLVLHDSLDDASDAISSRSENERFSSVRDILVNGWFELDEIWNLLEPYGYFDDKKDLHKFLEWLRDKRRVAYRDDRYRWVA